MLSCACAIITGVVVAIIYWALLIAPTVRSFPFLTLVSRPFIGTIVRLSLVGLASYSMLHYGLNHLILMMIAFYTALMVIIIAYKGVH